MLSHFAKLYVLNVPQISDPYSKIGFICVLNILMDRKGGNLDSLILLFKAKIALLALIERFSGVPFKSQFLAPNVKPR